MGGNDDSCAGRGGGDTAEGDRFWCWRRVLQQRAWMVWWVRVQVGCSRFLGSDLVVGGLGKGGSRLGLTLLLGAVALTSGLLVAYHRLTSAFADRDSRWSAAEAGYALVLFMALFFGLYSSLGWYFSV
jgi:hypothetical protein